MARTFTPEPTRTDQPVEVETRKLPNGNSAIVMPTSGDLVDPVFVSARNLARMCEDDYAAVLQWIEGERLRLAERAEQAERSARDAAEAMRPKLEEAAVGRRVWLEKNGL